MYSNWISRSDYFFEIPIVVAVADGVRIIQFYMVYNMGSSVQATRWILVLKKTLVRSETSHKFIMYFFL